MMDECVRHKVILKTLVAHSPAMSQTLEGGIKAFLTSKTWIYTYKYQAEWRNEMLWHNLLEMRQATSHGSIFWSLKGEWMPAGECHTSNQLIVIFLAIIYCLRMPLFRENEPGRDSRTPTFWWHPRHPSLNWPKKKLIECLFIPLECLLCAHRGVILNKPRIITLLLHRMAGWIPRVKIFPGLKL